MRERLLKAHTATETNLETDCKSLKTVIETTIGDIAQLFAEIARKKSLSAHNEKVADDYRDRMSAKLRGILHGVSDFEDAQNEYHSEAADMVADLKAQNRADSAVARSGLVAFSTETAGVLGAISTHARQTEQTLATEISQRAADEKKYRGAIVRALCKVQTQVESKLTTLQSNASLLEANLSAWAKKVDANLGDRVTKYTEFTEGIGEHLHTMRDTHDTASAQQLHTLAAHQKQLNTFLSDESTNQVVQSTPLIDNMQKHVQVYRAPVVALYCPILSKLFQTRWERRGMPRGAVNIPY